MYGTLTTSERISRMKIQLQDEQPFWAYLILKLDIKEDTEGKIPPWGGMGVNPKGELLWKKEFVDKLTDLELKFVLAHEVGHLVFSHLVRKGNRDAMTWNLVADAVLNEILNENGFRAPPKCVLPVDHKIELFGTLIENTNEKTAEQLYDEIPENSKDSGESGEGTKRFDDHGFGEGMSEGEKASSEEKWKDNLVEAAIHSKQRGQVPKGMERLIGDILNPKLGWKQLLRRYITNVLPFDYSFSRPNRKFQDIIMPGPVKETVEVVAHIDTSGSIGSEELKDFMGEIYGIAGSHQNLKMTLIECDAEINQVIELTSRDQSKLKKFNVKGGGGTSHKPVFDYIKKRIPSCKLLVSLTDGWSDIKEQAEPRYDVLWVVPKSGGAGNDSFPYGRILRL